MTVTEANAVNTLLRHVLRDSGESGPATEEDVIHAAQVLVNSARKRLAAGYTVQTVEPLLPRLTAPAPRVEVLHHRDPDYECEVTVWVDGVEAEAADVHSVDPGAGYPASHWRECLADLEAGDATAEVKARLRDLYEQHVDSQWNVGR